MYIFFNWIFLNIDNLTCHTTWTKTLSVRSTRSQCKCTNQSASNLYRMHIRRYLTCIFYCRESSFISSCNSDCGCSTAGYEPVCDHNQIVYFSPCHAGCSGVSDVNGTKVLVQFSMGSCVVATFIFILTV